MREVDNLIELTVERRMIPFWITKITRFYNEVMDGSDSRLLAYPFMESAIPNAVSVGLYLFIAVYGGRKFMKDRQPYNIRPFIVAYNLFMVLCSAYMFYEGIVSIWFHASFTSCEEVDYSSSPKALRVLRYSYLYWFSKHIEFLDTLFFIARKKFQHVSFLHVFHHAAMAFSLWYGIKLRGAGGIGTFFSQLNLFVHTLLYTYYAIAAMVPQYRKYLWWKKHLTFIQMLQFVLVFVHMGNLIAFHDCIYPKPAQYIIAAYAITFFILFANFWKNAYSKKKMKDA